MFPCSASSVRSSQDGDSDSEDYEQSGILLSDDEEASLDPSPLTGLFELLLFRSLLMKVCTSANIAPEQELQLDPSTTQDPNPLYSESVVTQRLIPCPSFFCNMVQKQWATLGTLSTPGGTERKLFNVAPSFSLLLEVPMGMSHYLLYFPLPLFQVTWLPL